MIWYDRNSLRWMVGDRPLNREPTPAERADADERAAADAAEARQALRDAGQSDLFEGQANDR